MSQSDVSLRSPTIRRMLIVQVVITVVFTCIAGVIAGEHGAVSATLGGLTNVFASIIYVFVADLGLRKSHSDGLWPLLRAEIVKLAFIALQIGLMLKFYAAVVLPALLITFFVTLLAWRVALMSKK